MSAAEKTPKKTPPPIPRGTFSDVVPVSRRERVEGPVDVPKPPPLPTGLASSAPPPMPPKAATLPPAIPFLRVPKPVRMVTDEPFASERTPIPDELDTVPEALAPEEETFVRRVPALDADLDADLDAEPSTLDLDTTLDLDEELDALDPRGFVADAPAADAAEALSEVDEDAETLDLGSSDRVDLDDLVDPLGGPRASLAPTLSPPPLVSPQGEERDRRGVVFAWSLAVLALVAGFYYFLKALVYGDPVAGFPTLITVMLFLGGVQLAVLGVMGEYLGRIFNETKTRPLYFANVILPSEKPALQNADPQPARARSDVAVANRDGETASQR